MDESNIIKLLFFEDLDQFDKLDNLQAFVNSNACQIYNIKPPETTIVLEKKTFTVPSKYGTVVPMFAGEKLAWSITIDGRHK